MRLRVIKRPTRHAIRARLATASFPSAFYMSSAESCLSPIHPDLAVPGPTRRTQELTDRFPPLIGHRLRAKRMSRRDRRQSNRPGCRPPTEMLTSWKAARQFMSEHIADVALLFVIVLASHGAGNAYALAAARKRPLWKAIVGSAFAVAVSALLLSWRW